MGSVLGFQSLPISSIYSSIRLAFFKDITPSTSGHPGRYRWRQSRHGARPFLATKDFGHSSEANAWSAATKYRIGLAGGVFYEP